MPQPETIGAASWPKRVRQFLSELFGSALIAHLRQELIQAKLEHARQMADLRAENRELLNRLLQVRGVLPITQAPQTQARPMVPAPTRWQQEYQKAVEENARAEAAEVPKES